MELVGERQMRHILEQQGGGPDDHTVPIAPEPEQLNTSVPKPRGRVTSLARLLEAD